MTIIYFYVLKEPEFIFSIFLNELIGSLYKIYPLL